MEIHALLFILYVLSKSITFFVEEGMGGEFTIQNIKEELSANLSINSCLRSGKSGREL